MKYLIHHSQKKTRIKFNKKKKQILKSTVESLHKAEYTCRLKVKGKVLPRTGREGPEGK
jgi:hypothetical protein